jgi:hypothetical protein
MAALAVAGIGLMVMCSSSLAAVMMMGGEEETPTPTPTTTAPAPARDVSCDLQRGDDVTVGCGNVYQSAENVPNDCGTTDTMPFIWDDEEGSACGIKKGDTVYSGCGYIYQKDRDVENQCVRFGNTKTAMIFTPTE